MDIRSFTSDSEALTEFIGLPWALRGEDPGWIPPIGDSVRAQLDDANPFFRHGRARHFLAADEGRPVGRCSAIIDDRLTVEGASVGMVGYFEVEPEYSAAAALLDEALSWLKAGGSSTVWGPIDFSIFNGYRFKTGGFDRTPFFGEPDNPPFYPEYFLRYGFEELESFCSWDLDEAAVRTLERSNVEGAARKGALASGYVDKALDVERFDQEVGALHHLALKCFKDHTAFVPLSPEEFAFWNQSPPALLAPELIRIVWSPEGEPAGASYAYPDWGPLLRKLDGVATPETLSAALASVTIDRAVYHTAMVAPGHRGRGLVNLAWASFIHGCLSRGYTRAVSGLANLERVDWTDYVGVGPPSREYALYAIGV